MELYIDQSIARVVMADEINLVDKLKIYRGHVAYTPMATSFNMRHGDLELIRGICEEIALPLVEATRLSGRHTFMIARGVFYSEAVNVPLVVVRVYFSQGNEQEEVRLIHGSMYAEVQHIMECFNTDNLYLFLVYPSGTFSMRIISRDDDYIRHLINREEEFLAVVMKSMSHIH